MDHYARISRVFESAKQIPFDDTSKIVLISDCHRGDGSWADDFSKNQNLYFAALTHYSLQNFTYIELGDGDELWKNKRMSDILQVHSDAFWLLSQFYREGRLYCLYGNHDLYKRNSRFVKKYLSAYFDESQRKLIPIFEDMQFYEGITLIHTLTDNQIFLIHGHQADSLNSDLWRISRFLVRHLWKPLELIGVRDPTSTAKNYKKKELVERRLIEWVLRQNRMLVAGHTHRPVFPSPGEPSYFNDGSCVHPRCITALEIAQGSIELVKWHVKTRDDGTLFVGRDVLSGPNSLTDYFGASPPSSKNKTSSHLPN